MLDFLRHLFLPHPSNNHRPKVLHHSSFISYILLAIAIQLVFQITTITRPQVLGLATDINKDRILTLVNEARVQNGLAPLKMDSLLSQAAGLKAEDMFAKNYWAHFAPNGTSPWDFFNGVGYRYLYAGENLARNFATSDQVVTAWLNSPTHRANILNGNYKDIGLGIVNGKLDNEETTLVVEFFGTKQAIAPEVKSISTAQPNSQKLVPVIVTPAPQQQKVLPLAWSPVWDIFQATKGFAYAVAVFLLLVLAVDAYMVKKKKIIRASGNNIAHMAILIFLLLAIYLTKTGFIL